MHSVYLQALCQHVSHFGFLDGRMSDIRVRAFGRVYRLHRLFLVQASFFNSLFCAGFAEGRDDLSDINTVAGGLASDADDVTTDDERGILDLPFEDPNISRPAFEYCIAHLYGAAPELVLPEWASPQPTQPLSSAFIMPTASGSGTLPHSASSVGKSDTGPNPTTASSSTKQHPATPRFLLSLLATSIYLGIPSVTTHVITLIMYSITPFTIMHYLRFATGQTILGATEAMQRSVMHEMALSGLDASTAERHGSMSARPDVWDWELEGPLTGLEHLGKERRTPVKRARPARSQPQQATSQPYSGDHGTPREDRSLLQQTKNLSLDDGESTGPNSYGDHHSTAPASPQMQVVGELSTKMEQSTETDISSHSNVSSVSGPSSAREAERKRAGKHGPSTSSGQGGAASHAVGGSVEAASTGANSGTDYQTDDGDRSTQPFTRSFPLRPPLLGEGESEARKIFQQPVRPRGGKKDSPSFATVKPGESHFTSSTSPRLNNVLGASLSPAMSSRPAKRSSFYYGSWGDKMGEACACWLVRFGADILDEEIIADEQRAAETEAWMMMRAQIRSRSVGPSALDRDGGGAGGGPAPWQLALQIPSGDVSNSFYSAAGLPASPSPFGKKATANAHSTPRAGPAMSGNMRGWTVSQDDYASDETSSVRGGLGVFGDSAYLDAPDEDRFIQTYMLPYGQIPEAEQISRHPPLLVWSLGHMSSDWVREVISSDSFFVRTEWERFVFATRVVELRRRQKLRRLAVLKMCGYIDSDEDEDESSDDDGHTVGDSEQASDTSTSAPSLGEQWRQLSGHDSSTVGEEDEEEDGDDEDDDDELVFGHSGPYGKAGRRPSHNRARAGKGKSAGGRSARQDRSPVARRTSFVSSDHTAGDARKSVKGSPASLSTKRSQKRGATRAGTKSMLRRERPPRPTMAGLGLPRDADEFEYEDLFKKGIYYTHMSFDELNRISSKVSSMTGTTFVPLSVLQSALWAGSELKNHILSTGSLSHLGSGTLAGGSSADPPPQLPNMWPEHAGDDTNAGGGAGAEQGGQNGQAMNNSATLPPIKDLGISSTLSEFRLAAEAMLKGNSSFHSGPGKLFDPNLSYLVSGQDHSRPPISLGGHMASPLMLGAASKPGALLGKRYFPVLTDSTIRLGGSTTPIFGSGGATTASQGGAATSADKSTYPDQSMVAPPSPATKASGAMGVAAAKDPLAFTISSSLQATSQSSGSAPGSLPAQVVAALDGGAGAHSSGGGAGGRGRSGGKYFGISNCVRTGRELAADATLLEEAQARAALELSEESSSLSASDMEEMGDDKATDGEQPTSGKGGAQAKPSSSRKRRQEELIRNELENSRWTGYEPMRIGAEFYGVDTLADKQRLYSPTFFYAGSLWNLYVQTTKKSKGLQLGVYLHRQAPHDPLPVVNLPPITVPRLLRRPDDGPLERSTTPNHPPRDASRSSPAPSAAPQQRGGVSFAHRHNHGGAGSVPSLYLNIASSSGLPGAVISGATNAQSSSSVRLASSSTASVPMSLATVGNTAAAAAGVGGAGGSAVPLSSSPSSRSYGGGATPTTSSILANSQAPIPGSTLGTGGASSHAGAGGGGSGGAGTGGSLFHAVNARYQEVASAADNTASASDALPAGQGGGASTAGTGGPTGPNASVLNRNMTIAELNATMDRVARAFEAATSRNGSDGNAGGGGNGAPGSGSGSGAGAGAAGGEGSSTDAGAAAGTISSSTPTTMQAPPPQVPYTDPRRELRAFFSIHCPSPMGSSLTRFSSGPDRFALTQSWGWKSSSLLMTMYLPERKLTEAKTEAHRSFRCVCTLSLGP